MRFALVLTILFLSGCATDGGLTKEDQSRQAIRKQAYTAPFPMPDMTAQPQFNDPDAFALQPGPVGSKYLNAGPAPAESDAEGGAAALVMPPATAPAPPQAARQPATQQPQVPQEPEWMTPARKKMYEKAYEAGRQYREQYIAAKRPVFRLKYRHEYPTMSDEEVEVLVNDALEDGLREEARRRSAGSVVKPSVNCTSSQVGSYTYTDCY
ncbi:hypothetical protein [Nitrospira lenta]|uniref:Lipoprotein n=1 Tax=Nitrospira lenta TaxID=1436998 RepID=A0A330L4I7_9BACT|nr:hypothetical protein [Nitrospira lenta]SPP64738.1 hypothetical protein NITLEN_20378 [Nitrospira lenta]